MNAPHKQELQIVQAFSAVAVPDKIFEQSNIKELVQDMVKEQEAVQNDSDKLHRLRREKAEGNFFGNWLHDRGDKVQDAQLDLSTSIGRLTKTSSQLLVVNTAISKVLAEQQTILLRQQAMLEEQARKIQSQNERILDQQHELAEQQKKINDANEGLMQAKGVTQAQAMQLVGCVQRVAESEQKIAEANDLLRAAVEAQLNEVLAQCSARVHAGLAETQRVQKDSEDRIEKLIAEGIRANQDALAQAADTLKEEITARLGNLLVPLEQRIAGQDIELKQISGLLRHEMEEASAEVGRRIDLMQQSQVVAAVRTKLAIYTVASLALASLCWHVATKFVTG